MNRKLAFESAKKAILNTINTIIKKNLAEGKGFNDCQEEIKKVMDCWEHELEQSFGNCVCNPFGGVIEVLITNLEKNGLYPKPMQPNSTATLAEDFAKKSNIEIASAFADYFKKNIPSKDRRNDILELMQTAFNQEWRYKQYK
jgi:hypothetical protein